MQANATVNLNAAVANDTTRAGVDWQVCPSSCGFFTCYGATKFKATFSVNLCRMKA